MASWKIPRPLSQQVAAVRLCGITTPCMYVNVQTRKKRWGLPKIHCYAIAWIICTLGIKKRLLWLLAYPPHNQGTPDPPPNSTPTTPTHGHTEYVLEYTGSHKGKHNRTLHSINIALRMRGHGGGMVVIEAYNVHIVGRLPGPAAATVDMRTVYMYLPAIWNS